MTQLVGSAADSSQPRAGARWIWRSLDWLLFTALVGAVLGASQAHRFMGSYGGRWTYGALLYGMLWAFEGARYGAIIGPAWYLTRQSNVLVGVLVGILLGVAVFLIGRTVWLPLTFLMLRSPEPLMAVLQNAFGEAVPQVPGIASQAVLIAVFVAGISWLGQRIFTEPSAAGAASPVAADPGKADTVTAGSADSDK